MMLMPAPPINEKPTLDVINSSPRITINSANPVTILSGEIELETPGKLHISGVILGTFYHVCGIAVYVDDQPIGMGIGTNRCHTDCAFVSYGNGNHGWLNTLPYALTTNQLEAGKHEIRIGVICRWAGTSRTTYINNRSHNDMASSSTLLVKAL